MEPIRVQVLSGTRRNSSLYHIGDGYFFTINVRSDSTWYLRCVDHSRQCRAKAFVNLENGTFHSYNPHNHGPDLFRVQNRIERERILHEAADVQQYATLSEVAAHQMDMFPDQSNVVSSMLRAMGRARFNAYPTPPQSLRQLDQILKDPQFESLSATTGFVDNIYLGSTEATDGSFVILFLSAHCQKFIKFCKHLIGISTVFNIGVPPAYNMYVLVTIWDDSILILGWVVLERATEQAYHSAFTLLKTSLENVSLKLIVCQEDSPEETAFRAVFPFVEVNCSLYTFTKTLCGMFTSRAQLTQEQLQDSQLLYLVGICCALTMIPANFLNDALLVVRTEITVTNPWYGHLLIEILNHLDRNYLNNPHRCVLFSMCGNSVRTSNVWETMDIVLEQNLNRNNFYSILGYMTTVEETTARKIEKIQQGRRVRGRNADSLSNNVEIDFLTKSLSQPFLSSATSLLNLLRAVALKKQHLLLKFLGHT